ncbi:hypothetical protein FN846DRAFT_931434 [Sphaerosporella brunnea]|uniref:Uncharacterized protein n=1 Tax=Sphaerosporella brunnea TaxID=1250544 RepID=A0A5J5F7H8_9PEZI|nr:hypothetical protein FN846DRAFT_931434 [Sphaerosporella brunnea]
MAAAAAGAALRRNGTADPQPGNVPTKRMLQRRESYSSNPSIGRRASVGSLTERTFRRSASAAMRRWSSHSDFAAGSVLSFGSELESIGEVSPPPKRQAGMRAAAVEAEREDNRTARTLSPPPPRTPTKTASLRTTSPQHSHAHFTTSTTTTAIKHSPPVRSVSPAKSALKNPTTTSPSHPRVSFSDEDSIYRMARNPSSSGEVVFLPDVVLIEPTPREELPDPVESIPRKRSTLAPSPIPDTYSFPRSRDHDCDSDSDDGDSIYTDALERIPPSPSPFSPASPDEFFTPLAPPPLPASYSQPTPTPSRRRSLTPPPRRRRQTMPAAPPSPEPSLLSDEEDDDVSSFARSYRPRSHTTSLRRSMRDQPQPSRAGYRASMPVNAGHRRRFSTSSTDSDEGARRRLGLGVGVRKFTNGGYGSSPGEGWRSRFDSSDSEDDSVGTGGSRGKLRKKSGGKGVGKGILSWMKRGNSLNKIPQHQLPLPPPVPPVTNGLGLVQRPVTAPASPPPLPMPQRKLANNLEPPSTPMTEGGRKKKKVWKRVFGRA